MAPMVVAPAQGEMRLGPNDLSAQLKAAGGQVAANHVAVKRPVPHISDIPGKQRIRLPPIGAVIVEHLALREAAGTDPMTHSPGRIIADPIRRVAHHQVGLRSGQHRLDIRRIGARRRRRGEPWRLPRRDVYAERPANLGSTAPRVRSEPDARPLWHGGKFSSCLGSLSG